MSSPFWPSQRAQCIYGFRYLVQQTNSKMKIRSQNHVLSRSDYRKMGVLPPGDLTTTCAWASPHAIKLYTGFVRLILRCLANIIWESQTPKTLSAFCPSMRVGGFLGCWAAACTDSGRSVLLVGKGSSKAIGEGCTVILEDGYEFGTPSLAW
jgi:hypothetical protein